jgi:hypothetical protein
MHSGYGHLMTHLVTTFSPLTAGVTARSRPRPPSGLQDIGAAGARVRESANRAVFHLHPSTLFSTQAADVAASRKRDGNNAMFVCGAY